MTRKGRWGLAGEKSDKLLSEHGIALRNNPTGEWLGEDDLIKSLGGVDGVLASNGMYTARVMDSAPNLRIIARVGVGYDHVDVAAATKRGIFVTLTQIPELSKSVAEEAITLMLCVLRRTTTVDNHVREGIYDAEAEGLNYREVYPLKMGIIGLGRIGSEVAKRARGLEMEVLYYDVIRRPDLEQSWGLRYVPLEQLLRESDVVSTHTPLNTNTKGAISDHEIGLMKRDAVLINTSRGAVVDEKAVYDALVEGRLGGAGLSVFAEEPLGPGSPFYKLGQKLPNVVLFPHAAGAGKLTTERMLLAATEEIIAVFEGREPKYPLNRELLSKR